MHDRFPIFARLDQESRQLQLCAGQRPSGDSRLDRAGQEITFRRVAAEAGASRSWLYLEPAIRAEIDRLRTTTSPRVPSAQRASSDSLHQRLDAMHDESLDCARRTGPCATSPPDASAINASAINASPTT